MFNQTGQAISRVRHPDKYQCVLQCIEKEEQGFECVKPITYVGEYNKEFRQDGRNYDFLGVSNEGYWEAIYRMKFDA